MKHRQSTRWRDELWDHIDRPRTMCFLYARGFEHNLTVIFRPDLFSKASASGLIMSESPVRIDGEIGNGVKRKRLTQRLR